MPWRLRSELKLSFRVTVDICSKMTAYRKYKYTLNFHNNASRCLSRWFKMSELMYIIGDEKYVYDV